MRIERVLLPGMRRLLLVAGGLVFVAGVPLFLLSGQTETVFAWTIAPPLTAAFLGAAYWASGVLEWLAARSQRWAQARIGVPAVLLFTTLTLVATLLHLDRFHFGSPDPRPVAAAWFWLGIYVVVPPVLAALLRLQAREPGGQPGIQLPLPRPLRALFAGQAAVLLLLGAALFLLPEPTRGLWPWPLTPLTARAVGAWLLGLGTAAGHVVHENDLERVRPALVAVLVFTVLESVALARYPGDVDWGRAQAWLYVLFLGSLALAGGVGLHALRRAGRAPAAHRPD